MRYRAGGMGKPREWEAHSEISARLFTRSLLSFAPGLRIDANPLPNSNLQVFIGKVKWYAACTKEECKPQGNNI